MPKVKYEVTRFLQTNLGNLLLSLPFRLSRHYNFVWTVKCSIYYQQFCKTLWTKTPKHMTLALSIVSEVKSRPQSIFSTVASLLAIQSARGFVSSLVWVLSPDSTEHDVCNTRMLFISCRHTSTTDACTTGTRDKLISRYRFSQLDAVTWRIHYLKAHMGSW